MGCRLLEVLIPAVISALLLGKGVQCRDARYSLKVPSQVTVEDGLCVRIPCSFSYDTSNDNPRDQLYGYWYVEDLWRGVKHLVATSEPERKNEIRSFFKHRFEVSAAKLGLGDCSLTIYDARAADQAKYHFRMKKGYKRYSYSAEGEKVFVEVTERKLDITIWGPLRAGQRENIFCKTQRCSTSKVPTINWAHDSQLSVLETSRTVDQRSVESRLVFNATAEDHRKNVTCKVIYGEGSSRRSAEKTVTLNVRYPPRIRFSGRLRHPSGYVERFGNFSRLDARVGDTLVVLCEADENPNGNQTWVRRISHPWKTWTQTPDNKLRFFTLKQQQEGDYECEAANEEGSSWEVFSLRVTGYDHSPTARP